MFYDILSGRHTGRIELFLGYELIIVSVSHFERSFIDYDISHVSEYALQTTELVFCLT